MLKLETFELNSWRFDSLFSCSVPSTEHTQKISICSLECIKNHCQKEIEKSLLDCKISRFLKFSTLLFWKIKFFPSTNHLAFLTIERYAIELTNIKILDKSIVPPGGTQAPEGESVLLLFWNVADFGVKCWVSKIFSSSICYCLW